MSRGRLSALEDPAEAIAAAKCWLARTRSRYDMAGLAIGAFHPEPCAFCAFPEDYLIEAVTEFADRIGIRSEGARLDVRVEGFLALPASEQSRLVQDAQYPVDTDT